METPLLKDVTREFTDRIRRLIATQVQNQVDKIFPDFGRIKKENGVIDAHRLNLFIDKYKEAIPISKINGLQSYVMTENEKYRELVEWRRHNIADRHSAKNPSPVPDNPENRI